MPAARGCASQCSQVSPLTGPGARDFETRIDHRHSAHRGDFPSPAGTVTIGMETRSMLSVTLFSPFDQLNGR